MNAIGNSSTAKTPTAQLERRPPRKGQPKDAATRFTSQPYKWLLRIGGRCGIRGPQPAVLNAMADHSPQPIVCTLTESDRQDRGGAWQKLLGSGLVERERVPGGIRLIAAPGAAAALVELIDLERECCAWIEFGLSEGADGAVATLTAQGDGEAALAGMFDIEPSAGS
jgi:hypothetical protein